LFQIGGSRYATGMIPDIRNVIPSFRALEILYGVKKPNQKQKAVLIKQNVQISGVS
jgi:hypothetical protein